MHITATISGLFALTSSPSERSASSGSSLSSVATRSISALFAAASISATFPEASFTESDSFSLRRAFSSSAFAAIFAGISAVPLTLRAAAVSERSFSLSRTALYAFIPVIISMRRVPAATELSETMRKRPISPVAPTWHPPHSSLEKSPNFTTRTVLPYFSPKRAMAPDFFAVSISVSKISALISERMTSFIMRSAFFSSSGVTAAK